MSDYWHFVDKKAEERMWREQEKRLKKELNCKHKKGCLLSACCKAHIQLKYSETTYMQESHRQLIERKSACIKCGEFCSIEFEWVELPKFIICSKGYAK